MTGAERARTRTPSEAMIRYLEERGPAEIDAHPFVRVVFDVHHGVLRRARVEKTDELGGAGDGRVSA